MQAVASHLRPNRASHRHAGCPWRTRIGLALAVALLLSSCLRPPGPQSPAQAASETSASSASVADAPYTWRSVVIMGGGFVTGLVYSPARKGILYARTDIGGAYRYDAGQGSWVPLTDFISHAQANYLGIESIAVDPTRADRVYMAVGMYTAEWAPAGAFMRSDDRGDSWKVMPVDFKMGGNDLSRSDGERLAIDPHQPKILYFGSRRNGLWRSQDEAETWTKVDTFPADEDSAKGLGLPFVLFDATSGKKGQATPAIYVGSQADGRIYRSSDAGKSWQVIKEPPEAGFLPRRAALDKDGTLYVTYALGDSPYALKDGAVLRYEPKQDLWTDITPLVPSEDDGFGYGGIAVDAQKPGTLLTTTMDRWSKGAEIFRSTDRGKTWKPLMATAVLDAGGAKHVYHHREKLDAPQWLGDIKIDPFDSDRAMIVEGGGVWATDNLRATAGGEPSRWSFHSKNLEETAIRDLVSPPQGAPLLSVMLDVCGFRHDDINVSPERGSFNNPACASGEDIDFAELKPSVMARVGSHPWDGSKSPRGALSTDGGATWKQFASEPEQCGGMGSVAVSADGGVILWAPRNAKVAFSRDGGKSWTPSKGLPALKESPDWGPWYIRLASDRVNPKKLYAFDALDGTVFASVDGGATFAATVSVPAVPEYEIHFSHIKAVAGREGDVWISTKTELTRATDSGKTFSALDSVEEAHAFGFGHPAPGASHPAIYLSGTVEGVTGFFRSDDGGETWLRINDDAHQYGGASVITGDPRIFGRVYVAPGGRGIVYGEPKAAGPRSAP